MLTTSRGSSIPAEVPAFASYPPPFSRPMNYVPALHAFSSTSPLVARPRPHSGWMNNLFTSSNGEEEERATRLVSDGFNWYCDPHIEDREKRCLTHSPSDVSDSTAELNAWSDTASAEDQTEEVEEEEVRGGRLRQVSMSAPQLAPVSSIPIPKRLSNDRLLSAGLSFDTLLFGDPKDREAKLLTEISNSGSNCSTKTFHLPANSALGESTRALLGLPEMQVNPTGLLTVQLMLFISGYRVVQQGMKRHCEYSVVLSCGEKKWVSWRRFSHFKVLSKCLQRRHRGACRAWAAVRKKQPRFRCLSEEYLSCKCSLLENFLRAVMFDMSSPQTLLAFLL